MECFVYDDGGKKASGRRGVSGDCGVRAMAIALGLEYSTCYIELAQANKEFGYKKSARNGLMKEVFQSVLKKRGWTWHKAPTFSGRKAYASDLPKGTFIARMSRHYATVIDGVPHDIFDSSPKMVYGYWTKESDLTGVFLKYHLERNTNDTQSNHKEDRQSSPELIYW